jgi:DNA polymerase-1
MLNCDVLFRLVRDCGQGDDIATADHRVHCSLNINTETGRLSARRPNLQNQPALEKDRYKV